LDELSATPSPTASIGLVPAAYICPNPPIAFATALYDYEASGDGEISITENERMEIYLREEEWIFVSVDRKNKKGGPSIGYVPANYVEEGDAQPDVEAEEVEPPAPATIPVRSAVSF